MEFQRKNESIGRYDAILWKIRVGFVVAAFGFLLVFGGAMKMHSEPHISALAIRPLFSVFVLSFVLAIVDFSFCVRQLRVVTAFDRLIDVALRRMGRRGRQGRRAGPWQALAMGQEHPGFDPADAVDARVSEALRADALPRDGRQLEAVERPFCLPEGLIRCWSAPSRRPTSR